MFVSRHQIVAKNNNKGRKMAMLKYLGSYNKKLKLLLDKIKYGEFLLSCSSQFIVLNSHIKNVKILMYKTKMLPSVLYKRGTLPFALKGTTQIEIV